MHIYCVTNLANGKIYIGQHSGLDLNNYLKCNIREALANRGGKVRLYHAFRKYGAESFAIRSLVRLPDNLNDEESQEQLNRLEIFFIRVLESQKREIGYNISGGGQGVLGVRRPHTEEEKKRMSEIMRGREITWGKKISEGLTGRKFSRETRDKISAAHRGKPKGRPSAQHIENNAAARRGQKRTEEQIARMVAGRKKNSNPAKKIRSPEYLLKLSENKKKWWATVGQERRQKVLDALNQGFRQSKEKEINGRTFN